MKLSVCLTHYNRPHLLAASLESLARQTRVPDEVLLWDDNSPNDPTDVARAYSTRFPKLIYHRNERNLGMPGNLNAVLSRASGDLIANLHDADEFHPTLLQKWEEALVSHPNAGMVFCGLDAAGKSDGAGAVWIHPCAECTEGRDFFHRHFVGTVGSVIWGTVMVRREVYERHLPFDPQFRNWADVDMWMRVCSTHDIAYVPEALITLDHSPTPVRAFSWEKFLITHRTHALNIHRLARDAGELNDWLGRQRRFTRMFYARHLVSRIARGEGKSVREGMRTARDAWVRMFERDWQLPPSGPVRFVRPVHRVAAGAGQKPEAGPEPFGSCP